MAQTVSYQGANIEIELSRSQEWVNTLQGLLTLLNADPRPTIHTMLAIERCEHELEFWRYVVDGHDTENTISQN